MLRLLAWTTPAVLHASDAFAWGLYTHMYFAQLLIWTLPFADRRLRRAVRRFPELCFAGACLPDVALFSAVTRARALADTHEWPVIARLLRTASGDDERAIAAGYAAHLMTDIVAHNYFVPAHEALWFDARLATHVACEWAMDFHIAPRLFVEPANMLERHGGRLALYAGKHLGCKVGTAAGALNLLGRCERALRASKLPQLIYRGARRFDRGIGARFDEYIHETAARLSQVDRLVSGEVPAWLADPGRELNPALLAASLTITGARSLPVNFFHATPR